MSTDDAFLSTEEAAAITGKSVQTMRRWAELGLVRARKLGKRAWQIEAASLPAPRGNVRRLTKLADLRDLPPGEYIIAGEAAQELVRKHIKSIEDWMGPEPTDHRRFVVGEQVRDDEFGVGLVVLRTENRHGNVQLGGSGRYLDRHYSNLHHGGFKPREWEDSE